MSSNPFDTLATSTSGTSRSDKGVRVLVVDDNPSMLSSLERVIGLSCDMTTAVDGLDALRKVRELDPFPVVVTDQRMPRLCGVELVLELEQITPRTECILLTGNAKDGGVSELLATGRLFRLLEKPCPIADILAAIQAAEHAYRAWNPGKPVSIS